MAKLRLTSKHIWQNIQSIKKICGLTSGLDVCLSMSIQFEGWVLYTPLTIQCVTSILHAIPSSKICGILWLRKLVREEFSPPGPRTDSKSIPHHCRGWPMKKTCSILKELYCLAKRIPGRLWQAQEESCDQRT